MGSKKAGYNVDSNTQEKITDGARGLYEKATGWVVWECGKSYANGRVDPRSIQSTPTRVWYWCMLDKQYCRWTHIYICSKRNTKAYNARTLFGSKSFREFFKWLLSIPNDTDGKWAAWRYFERSICGSHRPKTIQHANSWYPYNSYSFPAHDFKLPCIMIFARASQDTSVRSSLVGILGIDFLSVGNGNVSLSLRKS